MSKYYSTDPSENKFLEPEKIIKVIIQNFKHYFLTKKERLNFLREMNADQVLIEIYENAKPVRCLICNNDESSHRIFDVSDFIF